MLELNWKHRLTNNKFLGNGEDIVNKKAETSVDYLEFLKHEKELVFWS